MFEIDLLSGRILDMRDKVMKENIVNLRFEFEHCVNGLYPGTSCRVLYNGERIYYGETALHPKDNYCKEFGRKLALKRVLQTMGISKEHRTLVWRKYFEVRGISYE